MASSSASRKAAQFWNSTKDTPVHVTLYNRAEHKHAMDDFVRKLLESVYEFKEDHTNSNLKLLLGYPSSIIALAGSYYSYTHDFKETRLLVAACAVFYFVCSSLISLIAHREGNLIMSGKLPSKHYIKLFAEWKSGSSTYTYKLVTTRPDSTIETNATVSFDVGKVFDSNGLLLTSALYEQVSALLQTGTADKPHKN